MLTLATRHFYNFSCLSINSSNHVDSYGFYFCLAHDLQSILIGVLLIFMKASLSEILSVFSKYFLFLYSMSAQHSKKWQIIAPQKWFFLTILSQSQCQCLRFLHNHSELNPNLHSTQNIINFLDFTCQIPAKFSGYAKINNLFGCEKRFFISLKSVVRC